MTSQIQLDFANCFSPAEGPLLQEIYNQLQFSLPSSDMYSALRELQNKSKGRSQSCGPGTAPGPTLSSPLTQHCHQNSLGLHSGVLLVGTNTLLCKFSCRTRTEIYRIATIFP